MGYQRSFPLALQFPPLVPSLCNKFQTDAPLIATKIVGSMLWVYPIHNEVTLLADKALGSHASLS